MMRIVWFHAGRAVVSVVLFIFVVGPCDASHPRELISKNFIGTAVPDHKIAVIHPEIPEPDDQDDWQDPDSLPPTLFGRIDLSNPSSLSPMSADR